ncbi:MAG: glycosyltransferase [Alphaproteobacteria bacterium]|nr:glycosyltransferase [Alphaproteobacteria bacterium]
MSEARPPVRVLHVITGLGVGGAETMLAKLVAGLDPARHAARVVCLQAEGPLAAPIRAAGVAVDALGMRGAGDMPRALWRLVRLWRGFRPDLVQSWLYHADLMATLAQPFAHAFAPRANLVWSLRCSNMELGAYAPGTRRVLRALVRLSRRPALITANSRAGLDWHIALGYRPRASAIVPNGFDTARFRPDPAARAAFRAVLGVPGDALLVGMVARTDPMKDHATLMAAMAHLAPAHPRAQLVLVGKGTEALSVPPAIAGRVHALGQRGDVAAILPGLDLFCLSSAFGEGFPNALGEAMACGLPAVVTDVGDAGAILGGCGRVVAPRDAAALAGALSALLSLPEAERGALGAAARARVETEYALPAVIARYGALWDDLARGRAIG